MAREHCYEPFKMASPRILTQVCGLAGLRDLH